MGRAQPRRVDVFLWAYERSSARYVALRQSLGDPDAFRMRHRAALRQVVADVVCAAMDQKAADAHIAARAARQIDEEARASSRPRRRTC
jgi:hypothetical protein